MYICLQYHEFLNLLYVQLHTYMWLDLRKPSFHAQLHIIFRNTDFNYLKYYILEMRTDAWMPFTTNLHIATHSLYIHQLLNEQLAEFPTIWDCVLTRIANTANTPIGMEGGMWWGATKWHAKVMPTLKMHKLLVNMFRYHLMMKRVSCFCVHGNWLFSDPVTYVLLNICDSMWENLACKHNYKYLEILILIMWSIVTQKGKLILPWHLPQFYSYL